MFRFFRRVRTLTMPSRVDRDINKELEFHIRMEVDKRVRAGMTPEEARRTALRDFGGVERTREEVRDTRGLTFWDTLTQDVRFGLRTLRRSPGYTFAAVLILALGIGANTAIFSVINGVLLKPLPFADGGSVMLIQESAPASNLANVGVSIPELFDYRKRLQSVRDLVEYHSMSFVLLNQGEPDRVDTGVVSANFFNMLGIQPILGRTFVPADDVLGSEAVLVLSNEYWQQKFGGDRNVVGRVLQMNNRAHTVIGVLPAFPQYPRFNDVYMSTSACPFRASAEANLASSFRSFGGLQVFGRLVPGATQERATAEIATVATSFPKDHAKDYARAKSLTGRAEFLENRLVKDARPMLLALGGTTVLVLLIACANVANLAMARTVRRRRELAVRTALGAGRGRLLRQLVTESVIVALAGGILGLGLAWLSLDMLVGFVGRFTPRTSQIGIDGGVLAFTLAVSVVTGIVFGAAPALATRRNVSLAVRDGAAQAGDGAGRNRLRAGLVVAQVAVSFILLVGAALLLESFHRLSSVPLGYETDHVMSAAIFGNFGTGANSLTPKDIIASTNAILERLRSSPGVRAASATASVPLSNIRPAQAAIQIEARRTADDRATEADGNIASEGYFDTLGIPLLDGRDFRLSDDADAPAVAVINSSMAKYWDGANPIGGRFTFQNQQGTETTATIVGVVGDFRLYSADREIEPQFYTPVAQNGGNGTGRLLVRTDGNPRDLINTIKAAVHGVNKDTPVEELKTIDELRDGKLTSPRLTAALLTVFAGVALVITLAGITGVIATSVSQRTREFGLRMALGASRASVLQQVLGQGVILVVVGLVAGVAGAYGFSRLISGFLFATKPTDISAYLIVSAVFVIASVAACLAPARRATTIDPLTALRAD